MVGCFEWKNERPLRIEAGEEMPDGAVLSGGVETLQHDEQRVSLFQRFPTFGIEAAQSFRRGNAGREAELLMVDHLALHGDGQEHAKRGGEKHKGRGHGPRLMHTSDEQQRAERGGKR